MEDTIEKRFDYLRALTKDEMIVMIAELEEDIEFLEGILKDPRVSGEQKTDSRNDIDYDNAKLRALRTLLAEPIL